MQKIPKTHNQSPWIDARLLDAVEYVPIDDLKPYPGNPRKHPKREQKKLDASVGSFGCVIPLVVDADVNIVAGEAIYESLKRLGYTEAPILRIDHLSETEIKALRIALNRIAELAEWDEEKLVLELRHLVVLDCDVELTGFEAPEIDLIIGDALSAAGDNAADDIPDVESIAVSKLGDLWVLDGHTVFCGDATDIVAYDRLMDARMAQMVITDPPYNVPIRGNVSGLGKTKHGEFVRASGEMSDAEYETFLIAFICNLVGFSIEGSVHYLFIDWRHVGVLERVCRQYYGEQLNLCVWVKSNGGMGSMYRSRHELVLVFKKGHTPHINNVQLGRYGRNRTNVWEYDGCSTGTKERRADLALHPTVKPAEMIADAIKDASKPRGLILDPFLGAGTTLIACEMTGRVCAGLELDPRYVDVAIRRWEAYTGGEALHAGTGLTFAELRERRSGNQLLLPPPDAFEEV